MKTTNQNKSHISAEKPEEPQLLHTVKQKTELQKNVASKGLTQKFDRSINAPKVKSEKAVKPEFKESAAFSRKRVIYHKRVPQPAPRGQYKLLKNNVVVKDKLLNQKQRTILNAVKLNRARLHFKRISLDKMKQLKLSSRGKYSSVISSAGGSSGKFVAVGLGVKKAAGIAGKPVAAAKDKLLSQRADLSKSGDTGTEAMKLGLQGTGYAEKGARKIYNTVDSTFQHARKIYNRINRSVAHPAKNTLKTAKAAVKSTSRTVKTTTKAVRNTVKMAEKAAKTSAKAVKVTTKAAKTAAKLIEKAVRVVVKVVKAAGQAIAKAVNLIIETAPYSLIVIAVIVLLILLYLLISSIAGGFGGTVTAAGGWCIDDTESNSPSDIYENYKRFIDEADSVIDSKVTEKLKAKVTEFCVVITDEDEPHNIISYDDPYNYVTFFPADKKDEVINPMIDQFKTTEFDNEEYAKFLAALFVLMTREKQQAEGKTENEIYDFDFKREDFEEFIGEIVQVDTIDDTTTISNADGNTSRWGPTFLYKEIETESPVACPDRNCETEYREDCHDAYYEDEDGEKHYYCTGHPYCPENHTQMTVTLYTAEEYYNKSVEDIYNMTETERYRYNIAKEFIQLLLEDKEKGVI